MCCVTVVPQAHCQFMDESDRVLRNRPPINYRILAAEGRVEAAATSEVINDSDQLSGEFVVAVDNLSLNATSIIADVDTVNIVRNCDRNMASAKRAQLIVELETIFFQLKELYETVDEELSTMSCRETDRTFQELKILRITMVKTHQEMKLLDMDENGTNDYDARVQAACESSKLVMKQIRARLSSMEESKCKAEVEKDKEMK